MTVPLFGRPRGEAEFWRKEYERHARDRARAAPPPGWWYASDRHAPDCPDADYPELVGPCKCGALVLRAGLGPASATPPAGAFDLAILRGRAMVAGERAEVRVLCHGGRYTLWAGGLKPAAGSTPEGLERDACRSLRLAVVPQRFFYRPLAFDPADRPSWDAVRARVFRAAPPEKSHLARAVWDEVKAVRSVAMARDWTLRLPDDVVRWAWREILAHTYSPMNTRVARADSTADKRRYRAQRRAAEAAHAITDDWSAVGPDGALYLLGTDIGSTPTL